MCLLCCGELFGEGVVVCSLIRTPHLAADTLCVWPSGIGFGETVIVIIIASTSCNVYLFGLKMFLILHRLLECYIFMNQKHTRAAGSSQRHRRLVAIASWRKEVDPQAKVCAAKEIIPL